MSGFKVHPQRSKIIEVKEAKERSTTEEHSVENPEREMIQTVLLPLTASMQIFGLYFEKTDKLRTTRQFSRCYCLFISVILWLNVIRTFTIFTADGRLQTLLINMANTVLMVSAALLHTSCYRACVKGGIAEVLQTFNKDMSSRWAKKLRRQVIIHAGIAWSGTAFAVISCAYIFFSGHGYLNPMLAPFNTIILNSNPLILHIVSVVVIVLFFYAMGSTCFSLVWNYVLASIISHEFNECTKMLHGIVKNSEAAKGNFEMVRCRHQTLCRLVEKVDDCVCISNATYVVEFIFMIILDLYAILCDPVGMRNSLFAVFNNLFWIFACAFGLSVVAGAGIMINQSVRVSEHICFFKLIRLISISGVLTTKTFQR